MLVFGPVPKSDLITLFLNARHKHKDETTIFHEIHFPLFIVLGEFTLYGKSSEDRM